MFEFVFEFESVSLASLANMPFKIGSLLLRLVLALTGSVLELSLSSLVAVTRSGSSSVAVSAIPVFVSSKVRSAGTSSVSLSVSSSVKIEFLFFKLFSSSPRVLDRRHYPHHF